jgi:hypothetical protein
LLNIYKLPGRASGIDKGDANVSNFTPEPVTPSSAGRCLLKQQLTEQRLAVKCRLLRP